MADLTATATDRLGGVDGLAPVYAGAVAQPVAELTDTLAVTHGSSIAGGTLGLTDSVDVDFTLGIIVRDLTDTLSLTDAGGDQSIDDELAALLGATDTPGRTSTYVRTHADDLGATDGAGEGVDHVRTASSTLGALDVVAVVQEHAATIADDLGATDAAGPTLTVTLSDNLGGTDETSQVSALGVFREPADALGATDDATVSQGYGDAATDGLGLTDDTIASIGRNATASDEAGLTDDHTMALGRGVADALGLTDATSTTHDHVVILYDNLSGQGAIDTESAGAATRATVDRLSLSDDVTVTHVKAMSVNLTDTVSVTDLALPAIDYAITLADTLGLTDLASDAQATHHDRSVTDSFGIDDTVSLGFTMVRNITRTIADPIGATDRVERTTTYVRTADDSLGLTDTMDRELSVIKRNKNDTIGATDAIGWCVWVDRPESVVLRPVGATITRPTGCN